MGQGLIEPRTEEGNVVVDMMKDMLDSVTDSKRGLKFHRLGTKYDPNIEKESKLIKKASMQAHQNSSNLRLHK